MTRAEQAALKAWPKRKDGRLRYYHCTDDDVRKLYAQGYRKAEKDLALTWEDISEIADWISVCFTNCKEGDTSKEIYEEVLRRFNEQRNK